MWLTVKLSSMVFKRKAREELEGNQVPTSTERQWQQGSGAEMWWWWRSGFFFCSYLVQRGKSGWCVVTGNKLQRLNHMGWPPKWRELAHLWALLLRIWSILTFLGKGKTIQRKVKPQKKREEKDRRGKGKQQEDELKDSLADDDSSSTTTETSNPDTEPLLKEVQTAEKRRPLYSHVSPIGVVTVSLPHTILRFHTIPVKEEH